MSQAVIGNELINSYNQRSIKRGKSGDYFL